VIQNERLEEIATTEFLLRLIICSKKTTKMWHFLKFCLSFPPWWTQF